MLIFYFLVELETKNENEVMSIKHVIEQLANCSINMCHTTDTTGAHTVTNTLGDHTLIHLRLQVWKLTGMNLSTQPMVIVLCTMVSVQLI